MPPTRVTGKTVKDASLTSADMAPAHLDGLPGVPSLRTLGTGAQQAAAGNDSRLALNLKSFQHSQLSASFGPRFYACGQVRASGGTPNNAVPAGTLYCMPFVTPPGFVLRAVGLGNTNAPGGTTFNMGIYDSIGPQDLHPNLLIAQLGVANLNAFPIPFTITGLSLALPGNQVHWLAVVFGGTAPTCRTLNTGSADPILGHGATFTTGSAGIGHSAPFPIGLLPSPLLPASTTPITSNGTPFLLYGV